MKFQSFWLICVVLCGVSLSSYGAAPDSVPTPIIKTPIYRVYLALTGNDTHVGDSVNPVATFQRALRVIDSLSKNDIGDVFAEAVYYSGTYDQVAEQSPQMYSRGARNLNVSLRGKGKVILDGSNATLGAGSGVVQLLGSHIYVRNIHARNSPANGMKFGWNWDGLIINSGDILVEDCEVEGSIGHGIIAGVGIMNASNKTKFLDPAERIAFRRLTVHHTVNNNDHTKSPWGSAVKFNNVMYGIIEDCYVHDNGGEGIDLDNAWQVIIQGNISANNRANIYLDKASGVSVQNNLCYYTSSPSANIFLSMEVYSALVHDLFLVDVDIENNVLFGANGVAFWQGTVSAIQRAHFHNIHIRHNTMIGKTLTGSGMLHFAYAVSGGKPVQNVSIKNISFTNNIVSAHPDSVRTLVSGPLNPQPNMTFGHNLWSENPGVGYSVASDVIDSTLPPFVAANNLKRIIPHIDSNASFVFKVPVDSNVLVDYHGAERYTDSTNVGAVEKDTTGQWEKATFHTPSIAPPIHVYPNPTGDILTISTLNVLGSIRIVDKWGQVVAQVLEPHSNQVQLSVNHLKAGTYWILVMTNEGVVIEQLVKS
jgi:hypothetical protein